MTLSQRLYKQMKREVTEESAYGVGFFEGIESKIPIYAMIDAVREIASDGWVKADTSDAELKNMLITHSIKQLNYQDFKEVASYLFSYPKEQRDKDFEVRPISISRDYFKELQDKADELFSLKGRQEPDVTARLDRAILDLEYTPTPTGDLVLGIDREKEEVLLYRQPESAMVDDWEVLGLENGLITDYRSSLSSQGQTVAYLFEQDFPAVTNFLYETIVNTYRSMNPDVWAIRFSDEVVALLDEAGELNQEFYSTANFDSLYQAYIYGSHSSAFKQVYPTYHEYIGDYIDTAEDLMSVSYRQLGIELADDLLDRHLGTLNDLLAGYQRELVLHEEVGYSQGDRWELAYLRDTTIEERGDVLRYLKHEVGAFYRGDLAELAVIKLAHIDMVHGFDGHEEDRFVIDSGWLVDYSLDAVKACYSGFERFSPLEKYQVLEREMEKMADELER